MRVLRIGHDRACPPLLAHPVEVMHWTHASAQRVGIRNRGRDINLGEKDRLGQSTPVRQVAG